MSSAVAVQEQVDRTDLPYVLRMAVILGLTEALFVVLASFATRMFGGMVEEALLAVLVVVGLSVVVMLPGQWTRARTIQGIAGAAGISLAACGVFLLVDVSLLQPLGVYTHRWRDIGGGSNWWYHPVWWILGTYLSWLGAFAQSNQAARKGEASIPVLLGMLFTLMILLGILAIAVGFPGAGWNVATFGIAAVPALPLVTLLSALGSRRS